MQRLTPAERLVAAMAMEGLPYKSIARELGKSPATVRNQLHAIYQKLGVGNRMGYYDTSGALRDMLQNHLLQLLCIVAMEPPTSIAPNRCA